MRSWVYILPLIFPLAALYGLWAGGLATVLVIALDFALVPLVDLLIPGRGTEEDGLGGEHELGHDVVLFVGSILCWLGFGLLLVQLHAGVSGIMEFVGLMICGGILFGATGINIAHELGHRQSPVVSRFGQGLLLPSLYMHFTIEHNRGHHRWMATPHDPATARRGEILYTFWFRSVIGGWLSAWRIEAKRLKGRGVGAHLRGNLMLHSQLVQLTAGVLVGVFLGPVALIGWVGAAIVGFLLLETVNYVEHYGMQRAKLPNGRYERVSRRHSWTSDHPLSRALLFELPRHADHHAHAGRPFGALRHFADAPQLPTGYAGMVLLALVPPLYFRVMDEAIDRETVRLAA
jgi:alkane 1-monooxygenase